jgi:hypothetical protein
MGRMTLTPTVASQWLRWSLATILPGLPLNHHPPNFHIPSNLSYQHLTLGVLYNMFILVNMYVY